MKKDKIDDKEHDVMHEQEKEKLLLSQVKN